ncbi:MAG TPA: hypothetical protein VE623_08805 [Acidimicrobiales bacterium]|jgi:hypothetical protein|nr:hypothetical protein [Acidimicrobiales bacterium]
MLRITTTVGPAELIAGRAYVHDAELDGDEELTIGMRVAVQDQSGRVSAAAVTSRADARWQLTIQP